MSRSAETVGRGGSGGSGEDPALRADARRNRARIVAAARELFVDEGVDVPLDAIARRAGVGIATLYRRFADRDALVSAVARDAFTAVRDLADQVTGAEDPPRLPRFVAGLAELRVGGLMTSIWPAITTLEESPELTAVFEDLLTSVDRLVAAAHTAGELRQDVETQDVLLLLAAITRPLEGLPTSFSDAAAPRLLALAIDGLRPRAEAQELPPRPPAPDPGSLRHVPRGWTGEAPSRR